MTDRRYVDLLAVAGSSLLLVALVLIVPSAKPLRIILGLPFVLFFPGYTLMAALFPRRTDLDPIERIALSLGLSIAIVPLIGLALNYSPWGIRLDPILAALTLFILLTTAVAAYRRRELPADETFAIEIGTQLPKWSESRLPDRFLAVGLGASLIALGVTGYFVATSSGSSESFTEFYILGPGGLAEDYPSVITLGDAADVIVGVINQEGEDTTYQFEVRIDGDVTDEPESVHVAKGDTWEDRITIVPAQVGPEQKVEFLLYREGEGDPYRNLHLFIDVAAADGSPQEPPSPTQAPTSTPSPTPTPEPTPEPTPTDGATTEFVYVVQAGDTLAALSERFGLEPATIATANGLDASEAIPPGRELFIPGVLYVIQPGDTLTDIAAAFDVSVAAIVAANEIEDEDSINWGEEIVIPKH